SSGVCEKQPKSGSCDDGKSCTGNGTCVNGSCQDGTVTSGCLIGGVCYSNGEKNPANKCQYCNENQPGSWSDVSCPSVDGSGCVGACDPNDGSCSFSSTNGTSCSDGQYCNGAETCDQGSCKPGNPVSCSPTGNPCTSNVCSNALRRCVVQNNDGAKCDADGDKCTIDICAGGICKLSYQDCCKTDAECVHSDPKFACAGRCLSGTCDYKRPKVAYTKCEDPNNPGNECIGYCDGDTLECVPKPIPRGANVSCTDNDGTPCTSGICDAGTCAPKDNGTCTPCTKDADCTDLDGNVCTGVCDQTTGYCNKSKPKPQGASCDDGKFCTTGTTCDGNGACGGGTTTTCTTTEICKTAICDPQQDACVTTSADDGAPCSDDTLACTNQQCIGGRCKVTGVTPGYCYIDSACWLDGQKNPNNLCLSCNSGNPTNWTPRICVIGQTCNPATGTCSGGCSCPITCQCLPGTCTCMGCGPLGCLTQ
ncbi:MAG: hypothetical protein KC609_09030, partial [Myxococcales bacterium]|nr:hypothetical protein [Myxococcales bacterium]